MTRETNENTPVANRKFKDTVFRMLFSEKEALLSLYNAVNSSNYTDADALEIVTLENAIYMGMKNDLAFILDMNLYLQIPLHRITDSASNGSVFPVVTEYFSTSSDHAFL